MTFVDGEIEAVDLVQKRVGLAKIIQAGRLTHAAIAKGAGTSRTRVTAIANGNTHGVSTDVLIRVLAATGHRAEVRVKKAAA